MYSGTTIRIKSGRIFGVHQKIDKISYAKLHEIIPKKTFFPSISDIIHFEGKNGPDGIKSKSPGKNEPWHFIDPKNSNIEFFTYISNHIQNLTMALKEKDGSRAAFEAAWLAHTITDGLTPAHHYPFDEHIEKIRGEENKTRSSIFSKIIMPGKNNRHRIINNWEHWGAKGVMTTHANFEIGIASSMYGRKIKSIDINKEQLDDLTSLNYIEVYKNILSNIVSLDMYQEFSSRGWSRKLARLSNEILLPNIIQAVVLGWYVAVKEV